MELKTCIEKIFNYALMTFLVIGTFFYIPVPRSMNSMEAIDFGFGVQEIFFRYGVIVLFCISSFMGAKRLFTDKLFIVFIIYIIATAAAKGFGIESRRAILNVFIAFVFYKTIIQHFDFKDLKKFSWVFFSILALNILFCVAQYFKHDPLFSSAETIQAGWQDTLVGLMKNKVHLSILSAMIAPFIIPIAWWIMILISIPLIVVGQSSAAAVAFLAGIGMVAYRKMQPKHFLILALLLFSTGAIYVFKFDMPTGQFGSRFQAWSATLTLALKQDPYFGQGIGSFAKLNMTTIQSNGIPQNWIWAHNEYLQLFYETGFFGLGIVILFIINNLKALFRYPRLNDIYLYSAASFIVICLVCVLQFPFHLGRFSGVLIFLMALNSAIIEEFNYNRRIITE